MEATLYQRILGDDWEALPRALRDMHGNRATLEAEGTAHVTRGTSLGARLAAAMFSFPESGRGVPLMVRFKATQDREIWTRSFAGRRFRTVQREGRGAWHGLLMERFGPFTFAIALTLADAKLHFPVRAWTLFGIPLPAAWAPVSNSYEHVAHGQFHFHVEMRHPWAGLIVRYQGCLPIIRGL